MHHVVPERPAADFYVLTRHADVFAAAVDTATFSSAQGLTVEYDELEAIGMTDNPPMVMLDPPDHTAFRQLVARGFTPRRSARWSPPYAPMSSTSSTTSPGTAAATSSRTCSSRCRAWSSLTTSGCPAVDRDQFDGWTDAIVAASASGSPMGAADAVVAMLGYFSELIERRRREPGDDTISHLLAAGVGEDERGLMSILAYVFTMVTGGNDTTTGNLGGAVQLLADHPDQRDALVADPSLIGDAVEEFLRLTSPVQGLARTTTRAVELHGATIPAGRKVLLLYGAANRDPRRYGADADELDIFRAPGQILTFSQGGHHCIGSAAARMQARVALEELLARIPHFAVDVEAVSWAPGPYVRRPLSVPLPFEVAAMSWLADDRSRLATERILDAAGELFTSAARTR